MNKESLHWNETLRDSTKEKYCRVVDEWLANGYDSAAAYQSVYPNADRKTAQMRFCKIKKMPKIAEYIKERRQEIYESQCIDIQRVTEEIAAIAFCKKGDSYIPSNVKLKALEMLQKAMREDAQASQQTDEIVIDLEDDLDEDNT